MISPFNRDITKYEIVGRDGVVLYYVNTAADTETLPEGQYHRGVHVFAETFGGGLIMQRINGKLTSSAFGHIITHELETEAAERLVKDAIGIRLPSDDFINVATLYPCKETEGEIVRFFTCLIDPKKELIKASSVVDSVITCKFDAVVYDVFADEKSYTPIFRILLDTYLTLHKC